LFSTSEDDITQYLITTRQAAIQMNTSQQAGFICRRFMSNRLSESDGNAFMESGSPVLNCTARDACATRFVASSKSFFRTPRARTDGLEHAAQSKEPRRVSCVSDASANEHGPKSGPRDHPGRAVSGKSAHARSVVHFSNLIE
jgi:hypothetical protein